VLLYATQVVLARLYGPAQLGLYALGVTVTEMVQVLAQLGMNHGVVRYVAHYQAERDISRVRGTILLALWTVFALGLVLAVLMFFGSAFLANEVFAKPFLETGIRIVAFAVPFFALMNIAGWATQGFQTVRYATYVQRMQRPLLNLVFIICFYLAGLELFGAYLAHTLSMVAGAALALYYLRRIFPKLLDRNTPPKFEAGALFGVSLPMIVANFTHRMNPWIAVTVLGVLATSGAVGIFNVAMRSAALVSLALEAFIIFSPIISTLYARGQLEDLKILYQDVSRWTFTGALATFLVILLLAKDVMAIFGPEFISGWVVLVVIAGGQLFSASVGTTSRVLSMTGNQNTVMLATFGSAATSALMSITLVPAYGIMGAGLGVAVGIILANVVMVFFIKRRLGLWPYNREYLKPLVVGIAVFASAYVGKAVLSLSPGVLPVLVFAPLFLIGFALLFLLFGLSPSDRQFLMALWTAVRRTVRRGA
jgi:O-antigen/teichoic acid export membrane protein